MARYVYLQPLLECPGCGCDFTALGGITITLAIGGQTVEVKSSLDARGILQDTDDDAVENGYHSETNCGSCGEPLQPYEHEDDSFTNPRLRKPPKSLEITERPGHPDD